MTNPLQEDKGLVKIHATCTEMDAIWRPTPCHDLGIDGQIEFLQPGTSISTGHIVAVQSKAGPSYFSNDDADYVYFYPEEKHRRYWRLLKLPVLLVLHNPNDGMTLYARVKVQMPDHGPIAVRKHDVFAADCRSHLIDISQEDNDAFDPQDILAAFKRVQCERGNGQVITGIDFLLACTNRTRRYFELRMCRVTSVFSLLSNHSGYGIGQHDYDYILRSVLLVHAHRLAEPFLSEFDEMWFGLSTVPDITVPLTARGDDVIDALWLNCGTLVSTDAYGHLHHASPLALAEAIATNAQEESDALDASDRMGIEPR